ncbi:MAG: Hsp20 family protein [Rhizobiales bacterium]|nr:Hsp20 family protein [Hyphomicrobiales bacterium]NRB14732.1 Hsp20 family protein [Hyphomicrobiales bacterium]
MRHFDFSPLYKTTVGFDRLASLFDELSTADNNSPAYPPYNIERINEDEYRISMAVAGFTEAELNIEIEGNALSISGQKVEKDDKTEYLHRGIATRNFERKFELDDYVIVNGADLENGLLHIALKREVPEAKKPKSIPIGNKTAKAEKLITV